MVLTVLGLRLTLRLASKRSLLFYFLLGYGYGRFVRKTFAYLEKFAVPRNEKLPARWERSSGRNDFITLLAKTTVGAEEIRW